MPILITGGAGFIGSHVALRLQDLGYATVVLDDFSQGDPRAVLAGELIEGDVGDPLLLSQIFQKFPIDTIFHFAAFTDVGESVTHPEKYFKNNAEKTKQLLQSAVEHGIKNFIFSSTAAVYGEPLTPKISEKHPTNPINPYGESKLIAENTIAEFEKNRGLKGIILRYFNAAGGDPQGRLKNCKKKESNLIPAALNALMHGKKLPLFGEDYDTPDGTCIRDYIHVWDLAEAHVLAWKALQQGAPSTLYNLGNGEGYSVKQVLKTVEEVTNKKLELIKSPRRPGDPPQLVADATKANRELHWFPQYPSIRTIVTDAYHGLCLP